MRSAAGGLRLTVIAWVLAPLAAVLALSVVPTPYLLIAPGNAVDLASRVVVEGRAPSHRRFFLTDVTVVDATALLLAGALLPGSRLVHRDRLVPRGESPATFDRVLEDAMTESQNVAAYVAERAAGLRVAEPPRRVFVSEVLPLSRAGATLHGGDALVSVQGRRIVALDDVSSVVGAMRAGDAARVEVERDGRRIALSVPTVTAPGGRRRLGILVRARTGRADLPVPVRFSVGDIAGSSGGLMFALQIYADLRGDRDVRPDTIAGTGTLDVRGRVGAIEGTVQKLIAAQRAGATLFLVPRANYRDVVRRSGVRVVAVDTFADALRAIDASGIR